MPTFRDQGVILKRSAAREADKIFHIYTQKHGKLIALAKGSRRIKSKLAGHLEPAMLSDLFIARGKRIDRLAGADLINSYAETRNSLPAMALVNYFLEVVDSLCEPEEPDEKIFDLIILALDETERFVLADKIKKEKFLKLIIWFGVKLLDILGLSADRESLSIDARSRLVFKKIREKENIDDLIKARIEIGELLEWHKLITEVLNRYLNRDLKSEKFLTKFLIEK